MDLLMHIDLLRCEKCSQHNKVLAACSACGHPRTKYIIAPLADHRKDAPLKWRCRTCFSQSDTSGYCPYCKRGMIPSVRTIRSGVGGPSGSTRSRVYRRDAGCLRCGIYKDLTLHHIVHRSQGGSNEDDNLQTLCIDCHSYVHDVLRLPSGKPFRSSMILHWYE